MAAQTLFLGPENAKKTAKTMFLPLKKLPIPIFFVRKSGKTVPQALDFLPETVRINTGKSTRLVSVPTTNVSEVSQPKALVPPKLLKQKITNPAISTREV